MLRKFLVTVVLASASIGVWSIVASDAVGPNLLGTGSFESPSVGRSARFRLDQTIGLCGAGTPASHPQPKCWKVVLGTVDLLPSGAITAQAGAQMLDLNGSGIGMVGQELIAVPNTHYEMTFWARSSRNQAMTVHGSVYWYAADGSIINNTPVLNATTAFGAWTQFTVDAPSPAGTAYARIYLRSGTAPLADAAAGPLVDSVVFHKV